MRPVTAGGVPGPPSPAVLPHFPLLVVVSAAVINLPYLPPARFAFPELTQQQDGLRKGKLSPWAPKQGQGDPEGACRGCANWVCAASHKGLGTPWEGGPLPFAVLRQCPAPDVPLPMPGVQIHSHEEPGASCQRRFIPFRGEQSGELTVCTAHTTPFLHAAFPGTPGKGKSLRALLPTSLPPRGPAGSQRSDFTRRTVQSHILGTSPAPDFPMHSPRTTRTREMSTATKGLRAGGAGHQHGSAWSHGEKEGGTGGSRTRPDILRGQQRDAKVTAWGHGAGRRWRVLPAHRGSFPEKELCVPAGNHRAGGNAPHFHGHPEEAPSSQAARGEAIPRPQLRGSPFACGQTPLTWS